MEKEIFGKTPGGEPVEIFTLTNARGLIARVTSWGAGLVSMRVPDRAGVLADVTLGFDTLEGYLDKHPHPRTSPAKAARTNFTGHTAHFAGSPGRCRRRFVRDYIRQMSSSRS